MIKSENVVLLQIFLKFDAEYCVQALTKIKRAINKPMFPAMHDKRHMAFVIRTNESPQQLVDRLRHSLDDDSITNCWAVIVNRNVACRDGGLDSLKTRVGMAYEQIRSAAKPQHVPNGQVFKKNLPKNAAVQVAVKPKRKRKRPYYANSQDRQ